MGKRERIPRDSRAFRVPALRRKSLKGEVSTLVVGGDATPAAEDDEAFVTAAAAEEDKDDDEEDEALLLDEAFDCFEAFHADAEEDDEAEEGKPDDSSSSTSSLSSSSSSAPSDHVRDSEAFVGPFFVVSFSSFSLDEFEEEERGSIAFIEEEEDEEDVFGRFEEPSLDWFESADDLRFKPTEGRGPSPSSKERVRGRDEDDCALLGFCFWYCIALVDVKKFTVEQKFVGTRGLC